MKAATAGLSFVPALGLLAMLATQGAGSAAQEQHRPEDRSTVEPPRVGPEQDVPSGTTYTRIYVEIVPQVLHDYLLGSDEVVRGTVLEQHAVFPEIGVPYTEVALRVTSVVKGQALEPGVERVLPVRVGGAWTEERVVEVIGAPRFAPGDEALLFLVSYLDPRTEREYFGIRGLDHGTYRARPDERGQPVVRGPLARGERDLDAFEARLREARRGLVERGLVERGEEPR